MGFSRWVSGAALGAVLVVGAAGAEAQDVLSTEVASPEVPSYDVKFTRIRDAVPNRFFNPDTTAVDPSNPNRLVIGLHSGIDWTVWKATEFRASSAAYSYTGAMDTLRVTISAPEGHYISKITYSQRGSGSVARIGFANGAGNWTVGGQVFNLGSFGTNPTLSRTVDLSDRQLTRVAVAVTMNLSAFATASLGSATVAITGAEILVEVLPLP